LTKAIRFALGDLRVVERHFSLFETRQQREGRLGSRRVARLD
jgi:hypothetical protein